MVNKVQLFEYQVTWQHSTAVASLEVKILFVTTLAATISRIATLKAPLTSCLETDNPFTW